jgi:hypothetical protein
MALKHPRLRFDLTLPDGGGTHNRTAEVSGYISDRAKLIELLLHPWPDGTKVTNLRQIGKDGKDLAVQPDELKEPAPVAPVVIAEAEAVAK